MRSFVTFIIDNGRELDRKLKTMFTKPETMSAQPAIVVIRLYVANRLTGGPTWLKSDTTELK